ncbi:hypothetical protein HK104_010664 [Borealophlyctis nickersoniae]|nr:hypothetical protein HK104_010664 [Borealophlyctis nickersoniae]
MGTTRTRPTRPNKIKSQKAEIGVVMEQLADAQEEIATLRARVVELENHLAVSTNTHETVATNAYEVAATNADEGGSKNADHEWVMKTEPAQPNYASERSTSWKKLVDQARPGQRRNFLPVIRKRLNAAVKQWHLNTLGPVQAALCVAVSRDKARNPILAIPESLQTKFLEWFDSMDPEFEEEEEEEVTIVEGDGGVPLFQAPWSAEDWDSLVALAAICGRTLSPYDEIMAKTSVPEIETCPLHDAVGQKEEGERVAEVDGGEVAIPAAAEETSLEKTPTNAPIFELEALEPVTANITNADTEHDREPDSSSTLTAFFGHWDDQESSPMELETPNPPSAAAALIAITNTDKEEADVPSSLTKCSNMNWDDHEPRGTPRADVVLTGFKRLMRESPLSLAEKEHDQRKKRKDDVGNGSEVVGWETMTGKG